MGSLSRFGSANPLLSIKVCMSGQTADNFKKNYEPVLKSPKGLKI